MHSTRDQIRRVARALLVLLFLSIGFSLVHASVHPHAADASDACVACQWVKHSPTIASTAAPAFASWDVETPLATSNAVVPAAIARGTAASRAPPRCA